MSPSKAAETEKTMPDIETAPIACTLAPDAFRDRASWIRDLTRRSLRSHRRDGVALHLLYEPDAAAEIRELVTHLPRPASTGGAFFFPREGTISAASYWWSAGRWAAPGATPTQRFVHSTNDHAGKVPPCIQRGGLSFPAPTKG
jgi:hypothetical protein